MDNYLRVVELGTFNLLKDTIVNEKNQENQTPLHIISSLSVFSKDKFSKAKFYLKLGADVNILDNRGLSPLMYAVITDDIVLVKSMLKHNGDLSIKTGNNQDILDICVSQKMYELLKK